MEASPSEVGPFALLTRLGEGAMGVVWRATHRASGRAVAVKVLGRQRAATARFLDEVRAMAALHHPAVVAIHDYGHLEQDGRRPYLAMELVEGDSLQSWQGRLGWPALQHVLLALLGGLGHAHAHGLVHRDLKPGNVLVSPDRAVVKLTDFGLAATLEVDAGLPSVGEEQRLLGTPAYMAPEQVEARWRDYGPWTDLYALGCLAWAMATGEPPFRRPGMSAVETLLAQRSAPLPAFEPRHPMPAGFEAWLRCLLRKVPAARFQRAADAAWALGRLDGAAEVAGVAAALAEAGTEATLSDATRIDGPPTLASDAEGAPPGVAGTPAEGPAPPAAPVPPDWRSAEPPAVPPALCLFGMRAVPVVGRAAERDLLWAALRQVAAEGRARAVVMTGAAGVGKSCLARWLTQQAHASGAAEPLRLLAGPLPGPAHGLGAMLARWFRCAGLEGAAVRERVADRLAALGLGDADDAATLAEIVRPSERRVLGPTAIHAATGELVCRLAAQRPVVLHLDDVQWSREALDFAAALLDRQARRPAPVLLVLTARSDALAERPDEAQQVAALTARPEVSTLALDALPPADRPALLRTLLGADAELTERLARRSGGNPLFAIHLASDWLERGLLEGSMGGARLRPGVRTDTLDLPTDLHSVWTQRVDRLLEGRPAADRLALEVAAVLGQAVGGREWQAACAAAGVAASPSLLEALLRHALALRTDDGAADDWCFVHGMLRESLERGAREAGRSAGHHHACAAALAGEPARAARHLLAAGATDAAVPPLVAAIRAAIDVGDYAAAEEHLTALDEALAAARRTDAAVRRTEAGLLRARVGRHRGDAGAVDLADRALAEARQHGEEVLLAEALIERGAMAVNAGDGERAAALFDEALRRALTAGDLLLQARCRQWVGIVHFHRRELEPARRAFAQARATCEQIGEGIGAGHCAFFLGRVAEAAGDLAEARALCRDAYDVFARAGNRAGLGMCANQLGEIERLDGRPDVAERHYQEALRHWIAMGAKNAVYARANLAIVQLERGRYRRARPLLEETVAHFEHAGWHGAAADVHAHLAVCAAGLHDWPAFDRHLATAAAGRSDLGRADRDVARMLHRAGGLARDLGEVERARAAWQLSALHWRGLSDDAGLAAVQVALEALE